MDTRKFQDCKAILFDFGGTLDSDGEHWLDRFYELYEQAGLDFPPSEIKRVFYHADALCCADPNMVLLGLRPMMKNHVHLQFQALNLEDAEKEDVLVEAFCKKSEKFLRRNARILNRVRHSYRLGLVSNFCGNVATLCREAGLAESLDVILDSTQVGISKPDTEIFRMALERLKLSPEHAIFVGDSYERDMIPARGLGMKTIWLKGPHPRIPLNAGPVDAWISSLPELEVLIL
jgi:putative hydrolase of the HAD superfamily